MSTNNSTQSFNFPPPPENLIDFSKNNTNLNKQYSTTTTSTTTTSQNSNMRAVPPTPNQSNYNSSNTNNLNNYNINGTNPTFAEIPQQHISMQQNSYYEQPPPNYHGENPQVSTMDSFLSKGRVYSDQTKNKIIELNGQYKVTETVKKTAHDAKPKIVSGFNFMKTKFNDLLEGKGTRDTGGPDLNPAMVASNKNQQQYYQQPQQQYYQQTVSQQSQHYQPPQQQQSQQFFYEQQQPNPVPLKQYQSNISEPRKSDSYSVEQK
ncbi:hypothetical protein RB653_010091 [Dictyostelium firmibasis]|uniref:Uncharacterized protein n=1 Tax=Dictyostelium firmibasis TaxID=79012 RepID=A0AAN7YTF3_9MYCE